MFTVIYDTKGTVVNIVAGQSNKEHLLDTGNECLYIDKLPEYDYYRQILNVTNKQLKVIDLEISPEREREIRRIEITQEIAYYKNLFEENRYKLEKYVDGALTEEEYAPIRKQRAAWRMQINKLEEELKTLTTV